MGPGKSARKAIQEIGRPVFTTWEVSAVAGASLPSTSQSLKRMEREGLLVRAARGVWCVPVDPRFSQYHLVSYLTGGHRAYVSLFSALHLHGMVEQVPQIVHAATTAHSCSRQTTVGTYSFHRIDPGFFSGYDWYRGNGSFLIASPEKALVDCLYLSSRKSRRFGRFPEIDLTRTFSEHKAWSWVERIRFAVIRKNVHSKLAILIASSRDES